MNEWHKTTKNKLGIDCVYTDELAQDILSLHNLDIVKLFANLYGTTFTLEQIEDPLFNAIFAKPILRFILSTDDPRDPQIIWTTIVK